MNQVTLIGRVGKDPDVKYSQSGTAVCNFSLATSKKIKGEDQTQWHRCVAFGKTAEIISEYVSKGDQFAVSGEINYGSYDKDGTTVYTTDIIVFQFDFISGKKEQGQPEPQRQPQQQQQTPPEQDDIPF